MPPSGYWASLCNLNDANFLDEKDVEIAKLRSRLEKTEGETADAVEICKRVSELEAAVTTRTEELAGLSVLNAELSRQVVGLESACDSLNNKVVELEAERGRLRDQVEALDARLSKLSYQVDSELYPHMLTAVASHRWVIDHGLRLAFMKCCESVEYQTAFGKVVSLAIDQGEVGIEHDKADRDLSVVEAYDPGVKARCEKAIKELENISLPFLAHLEAYKDAPLERVMASLYLAGLPTPEDETLDFHKLQSILEQVIVPLYYEQGDRVSLAWFIVRLSLRKL
ncbi:hypothetical protein Tco_1046914 [Tanacetum coccineum]